MQCLITEPMRSDIKETTRQKKQTTKLAKTEFVILKAHSNNVKKQSDKTLTTQI